MATKISNVLYVKVGNVTVTKLENKKKARVDFRYQKISSFKSLFNKNWIC